MRKIIYLTIFVILLIVGSEVLRKFNLANIKIDNVPEIISDKKDEKPSALGNFLTASVAQRTGDFDSAIKFYERSLVEDPYNIEVLNKLYGLYLFKGNFDSAIEEAKRHVELDKEKNIKPADRSVIPYLLIALQDLKNNNTKEVVKLLEPLANPVIPDKTHLDAVVLPIILAWSYSIDADYKNAFRVIDSITADYMLSVFSYNRAVINDIANGKTVLIEDKDYPINTKARKLIGEVFFELGAYSMQTRNLEEAAIYLRLAHYMDTESYKYKKTLAMVFENMNRLEEAISVYDSVESTDKNHQDAMFSKALAYHNLEKDDEAIAILEKLKGEEKIAYQVSYAMGGISMGKKKFEDAVKYYSEAESLIKDYTPEHWNLFFNLGIAYDKSGDWQKAESNLKKSVQLAPENPEVLNYLAYSWLVKNKNIKQARAMLEEAVIRSAGAPHVLDSYGWAMYKLGLYSEALPFLEQASLALPYNAVINSHLGDLYWQLGRRKEALYQWKKARDYFDKENSDEITMDEINKKIEDGLN